MGGKSSKEPERHSKIAEQLEEEEEEEEVEQFPFVPDAVEYDEEGFVRSFAADDTEGIRAFFERYGFVVVDNVLSSAECERTVDEMWQEMEHTVREYYFKSVDAFDPSTWEVLSGVVSGTGIIGTTVANSDAAWANRQNDKAHRVFSTVIGEEDLLASVDRMCFMRPTQNVPLGKLPPNHPFVHALGLPKERVDKYVASLEGKPLPQEDEIMCKDCPKWVTADKWFHWDLNPWFWSFTDAERKELCDRHGVKFAPSFSEDDSTWTARCMTSFICEHNGTPNTGTTKVQGILALADSRENDGGFITVPGFHKQLRDWAKMRQSKALPAHFVQVPASEQWRDHAQKITMRRGSLVVWSSAMPHCNFPNASDRPRMCQYLKMFPRSLCSRPIERAAALQRLLGDRTSKLVTTEHGRRVLGLDASATSSSPSDEPGTGDSPCDDAAAASSSTS
eukprot:TRINITY_DN1226_c0_g1_i1.p1 TRINITY_DN1226_c0_g1~~TRINITY_DN1226_c0_g1_i1.p1  ORF type:complete len:449 (-),score=133.42 TRINITY_DN1226_c0_g1_i1:125-1471(-)